jgi:hypothetical protein
MDRYKWPNSDYDNCHKLPNTTPNSTKITGYNHIVFKNVTFAKVMAARFMKHFGDYVTSATTLPFCLIKR